MSDPEPAFLYVFRSADPPEGIWLTVELIDAITLIGRPEQGQPGIDLREPWVSRQHAQIVRRRDGDETTYTLEHTLGRSGSRLYSRLLLDPGKSALLRHSYTLNGNGPCLWW